MRLPISAPRFIRSRTDRSASKGPQVSNKVVTPLLRATWADSVMTSSYCPSYRTRRSGVMVKKRWTLASIMPGITNFPLAEIINAFEGTVVAGPPTEVIRPPSIKMTPSRMGVPPLPSMTVAPTTASASFLECVVNSYSDSTRLQKRGIDGRNSGCTVGRHQPLLRWARYCKLVGYVANVDGECEVLSAQTRIQIQRGIAWHANRGSRRRRCGFYQTQPLPSDVTIGAAHPCLPVIEQRPGVIRRQRSARCRCVRQLIAGLEKRRIFDHRLEVRVGVSG